MRQYQLVIGNRNYSSWSLRAWLVMKFADVEFSCEVMPLLTDETNQRLIKESPNRKVPFLKVEDLILSESLAIAEYMADLYPKKKLWPENPDQRALARSLCLRFISGFLNLRTDFPMNIRRKYKAISVSGDLQNEIDEVEYLIRSIREKYAFTGRFLFGECSIADAFFAPVVFRLRSYVSPKKLHKETRAYMDAILELPDVQGWIEMANDEKWIIESNEK